MYICSSATAGPISICNIDKYNKFLNTQAQSTQQRKNPECTYLNEITTKRIIILVLRAPMWSVRSTKFHWINRFALSSVFMVFLFLTKKTCITQNIRIDYNNYDIRTYKGQYLHATAYYFNIIVYIL